MVSFTDILTEGRGTMSHKEFNTANKGREGKLAINPDNGKEIPNYYIVSVSDKHYLMAEKTPKSIKLHFLGAWTDKEESMLIDPAELKILSKI